jgi:hypothetical protein
MSLFFERKHANRFVFGGIVLLAVIAAIIYLLGDFHTTVERSSLPLSHQVYVWQRDWDETLSRAVHGASPQTSRFVVLAAEISWESGQPKVVYVPIDYGVLKATGRSFGLAVRMGPYSGTFDTGDAATSLVTSIAVSLIAEARSNGLEPAELQFDFDCAESKLRWYRKLAAALDEQIHPVALTITALPCWLKHRSFARLARATDGYVLQVHSLERPVGPDVPLGLCDSAAALRWVEQAGRIGVPFRVALPTYGYIVVFDEDGGFVGLSAEGPPQAWDKGTILRAVYADPIAMAELAQSWQEARPYNMEALIWYRLPVESDKLNWKWVTLSAIMTGRIPRESLRVEVEYPEAGLAEIVLVNDGETDQSAELSVRIECEQEKVVASDGLRRYTIMKATPSSICLEYRGEKAFSTIRAGERWKIGWIRSRDEMEVKTHIGALQP